MTLQSPLARMQPSGRTAEERVALYGPAAWREHGILVVKADHPALTWADREWLKRIADLLYGGSAWRNGSGR